MVFRDNMPQKQKISYYSNGLLLSGTLHLPSAERSPLVIGSHGLYSSSESPKQIALAARCNRLGIAYFRFDHRGCGASQGEFEKVTSLEARCQDLIDAVATLKRRTTSGDRIGLFGSSMGGTVCLSVAAELGTGAVVTFAAPIRSHLQNEMPPRASPARSHGIFFDAAKHPFDISGRIGKIRNLLVIHGDADEVVPVGHAREIYNLAQDPKKLIIQPNGDHPMSNRVHQDEFMREASLWFADGLESD